jgi:TolA-binding protein
LLLLIKNFKKTKNDKGPSPVIFLVLLSFLLLLLTGCLFSPFSKGSVEGYIHEEIITGENRPLEGALVSITGSSNTALTDTDGYFRIDEVSIGSRTLTITKEGYITHKRLSIWIIEEEITLIDNGNPIVVRAVDDKYLFDGGIIYYDLSEYTNALTAFQQLITNYPNSEYADDAQYYIGYINEKKMGYYIQALLEYQGLINNYPDSSYVDDAQLGIGNCYYVTYDYSHAIEAYQKLIDDYPESSLLALSQYSIAQSYRKLANYEQAVIEYNKVIENYPESDYLAPAQYYIGYSYYEVQDYIQAIIEFQKVIINYYDNIWPDGQNRLIAPCAQYYIGWCYGQKLGQWNDAVTAYQLVIDNYPGSTWSNGQEIPPDAQYQIGWCYEQLELWCEAIDAYQLVIDNYPGTSWSNFAEERINAISENCPPS